MFEKEYNDLNVQNRDGNSGYVKGENFTVGAAAEFVGAEIIDREDSEYSEETLGEERTDGAVQASAKGNSAVSRKKSNKDKNQYTVAGFAGLFAPVAGVAAAAVAVVSAAAYAAAPPKADASLVYADPYSLVFFIDDFEENASGIANLTYGEEFYENEFSDDRYVFFDGLQAGTEYELAVKKGGNAEETLVKKSYLTPTEFGKRAFLRECAIDEEGLVFTVGEVELSRGEFYSVFVTDMRGKNLFTADDTAFDKTFYVDGISDDRAYVLIKVNNKAVAFSRADYIGDSYDYGNASWEWSADNRSAKATVQSTLGRPAKTVDASIDIEETSACESEGTRTIRASVSDPYGNEYFDEKTEVIPITGHAYGEPAFRWEVPPTGGYAATAVFTCAHDQSHVNEVAATVTEEHTEAGCEEEGEIKYTATVTFDNKTYIDEKIVILEASGHDGENVSFPQGFDSVNYATGEATINEKCTYVCDKCGKTVEEDYVIEPFEIKENTVEYVVRCGGQETVITLFEQDEMNDGSLYYERYENEAFSVSGVVPGEAGTTQTPTIDRMEIPATFFGFPVKRVSATAFVDMQETISTLVIGDSVEVIEATSFGNGNVRAVFIPVGWEFEVTDPSSGLVVKTYSAEDLASPEQVAAYLFDDSASAYVWTKKK